MAYRSMGVDLGVNTANYSAGLNKAAQETRNFAATVDAAGKKAGEGFRQGEAASKDYASAAEKAANATKKAEANIAALARRNTDLRALATEYKKVADAAERGSERQVAAARLAEVANKRLAASTAAAAASGSGVQAAGGAAGAVGALKAAQGSYLAYAAAAGTATAAINESIHAASDLQESQSKSVQVFGESSKAVEEFASTSARSMGLSKQATTEATATFGNLLRGIGQTQPEAAEMSMTMVQLAADMGSFSNIPVGDALADLKSGLVGEAEPMRKHGVLLSEATTKAEAYSSGIAKAGEELTEQQKVQARFNIIMEQTTLAQGDFARTSDGLANSEKTLASLTQDLAAELGTGLMPIYDKLVDVGAKVIEATLAIGEKFGGLGKIIGDVVKNAHPLMGILDLLPGKSKKAAEGTGQTDEAMKKQAESTYKAAAALDKHNEALEKIASDGGLSVEALTAAIGRSGDVGEAAFQRQEAAAKKFVQAVNAGVEAASKSFMRSVDAVERFSASSIASNAKREASSSKAADKIEANEDRVADAVQRVADIQESHAEKAAADREAYAEKVVKANEKITDAEERLADVTLAGIERMTDAHERYEDTVTAGAERVADAEERLSEVRISSGERVADADERYSETIAANKERVADAEERYADIVISQNERIADADQRLADIRVDSAERVQAAKDRLIEDRAAGQEAVRDAQRRLRELQTRDTGGTPEQRAEAARQRDIRRAREDLDKAKKRAAKTDEDNAKALAKAERDRIEAIAKAQANADEARADAVKRIAKAEEDLAKTRADAIKSDADAQKATDRARRDSVKAIADAEENLAKARAESVKNTAEAEKGIADARKDSAKAAQKAEEDLAKARAEANKLAEEGATIGVQTRAQARELERALDAVADAQKKAATAGTVASEEQTVAIKVTTEEMKEFYRKSLEAGEKFSEGIRGAIKKGYDPGFIARLLEQGPEEAAPILEAIAGDHDNSLRDLVNASEKAIEDMNFKIREVARITRMAVHSDNDQMNRDVSDAMRIMEANSAEGGKKTAEAIARELGIGVAEVERITKNFGITLADGINPILRAVGSPPIAMDQEAGGSRSSSGVQKYALGGLLPGHGGGDRIPLLAEGGEFIFSVDAVDNIGAENLEEMHQRARKGYVHGAPRTYHTGGFVYPEDVPKPPDSSMWGDMVGLAGAEVNKKAYDEVVAFVRANPPKRSGPGGYGYQALIDYLAAAGVDHQVTSTSRPGSITSSGALSLHAVGLAADFVSNNMREIFDTFLQITPSLQELFWDPAGKSVKNGEVVPWIVGGHGGDNEHVHAASWGSASEGPGVPGSGGSGSYSGGGELDQWIADGLRIAAKPDSWHAGIRARAMQESSGDPNAINNWDSNAAAGTPSKGLMQMIDPTFEAHKVPGYDDIWNPVHNVAAASNYIASRYGDPYSLPAGGYSRGGLVHFAGIMDNGAVVPPGAFLGYNATGRMEDLRPVGSGIDYDKLAAAVIRAADARPINFHINGKKFASATAGDLAEAMYKMRLEHR